MTEHGPRRLTRERHEHARALRACGLTWAAIAEQLGYRSRSGAQSAVERLYARRPESPAHRRQSLIDGLDLTKSMLFESLAQARRRKDANAIASLTREIRGVVDQQAKLDGLHAPAKVDVSVEHSFAATLEQMRGQLHEMIDAEVVDDDPKALGQ